MSSFPARGYNLEIVCIRPSTIASPEISVVLCTYNRAWILERALQTVLAQTLHSFELVILDDGSSDNTLELMETYQDPRIAVWKHVKNSGLGAARNSGIRVARAPLVAFFDSDDEMAPELLAAHVAGLADADFSFCQLDQRFGEVGRLFPPTGWHPVDDMLGELMNGNIISSQTMAMRKSIVERVGGPDESLPALEDWEFVLRLAANGCRFHYIPTAMAIAHDSADSMTRNVSKRIQAREMIITKHAALFAARPAVLAFHHIVLGSQHRKVGNFGAARKHCAAALRLQPWQPKAAADWLLAALRR